MRILIVDDRVPDPHFGAGFPRAYRLLMSLISLGHEVLFFPTLKQSIAELDLDLLKQYGINVWSDLDAHAGEHVDVTIMSRPHNVHYHLPILKRLFPDSKIIYDTEALWFRRYDLQLSITGRLPGWAYRYDEIGLARQVDMCWVVNDTEKTILEENGVKLVRKLAHSLDINPAGAPYEDRKDLMFVGGKLEEDSSNEDALWHYLENCWSSAWEQLQCDFNVTGEASTTRLLKNQFGHVNLMGHVNDLIPLYQTQRVFVAATRFATGIPWKVHEAMAHGIPCVISRLLGNQLGFTNDDVAMVCDTPQEFVAKTILLYQDKPTWEKLRQNAFDYVADDCSPEKFKNVIATSFEALGL